MGCPKTVSENERRTETEERKDCDVEQHRIDPGGQEDTRLPEPSPESDEQLRPELE